MPSLFSRSRTQSTPQKNNYNSTDAGASPASLDEFGRVSSRNSNHPFALNVTTPSKKDKKKAKDLAKQRSKTLGAKGDPHQLDPDQPPPLPDGSFLPLNLDLPKYLQDASPTTTTTTDDQHPGGTDYGYLSYQRHVVLGLEQLEVLVNVVADQLETRGGITTPFIFSTTALDISAAAIKRLIRSFLTMCSAQASLGFADAQRAWKEEAKFAGPHELGMCLRWGLARVVRVSGGQDVRGLIPWDHYVQFRDSEAALRYPSGHFETILHELDPALQSIIVRLLFLLTRLTANSTSSGHTPPTLSPLFGPLLFGLGPATLAFHHTYIHYLRAVNATEHLILAFIRWQDTPRLGIPTTSHHQQQQPSGSATALGVPIRLKEWIKGYPAMLPFLHEQQQQQQLHPHTSSSSAHPQHHHKNAIIKHPRKGAKTVTLTSVRRNVRMYSPDLVRTAATWAHRSHTTSTSHNMNNNNKSPTSAAQYHHTGVTNGLANSKEWERIAPTTLKLPPRYSETFKKRMNMLPGFHPDNAPGIGYSQSGGSLGSDGGGNAGGGGGNTGGRGGRALASTLTIGTISQSTSTATSDKDYFGLGKREGEDRFRSLTDLKWGEFESMGFASLGDNDKKLQFDLTEGAREERAAKRQTMSWNDFSTTGFSRTDAPLNATLQFSAPLAISVSNWPARDAELTKKIKKTEKQLPQFGWDTEPVMGNEEIVEEAFVDVFCDLIYGGGWMDLERSEGLDRDVNWALVEFKSLPPNRTTVVGGSDPRTSTTLILFEEFVPLEYRQQLAVTSTTRRRLPALFSPSKKQWKQAATLNGRPYVVGHVPRSPSYREMEFEGLLQGGGGTKVISLGSKASTRVVSTISTLPPPTPAVGAGAGAAGLDASPLPPVPPLPAAYATPTKKSSQNLTSAGGGTGASVLSPLSIPGGLAPNPPKSDASHSDSTTTAVSPSFAAGTGIGSSGTGSAAVNKKPSASRFRITNVIVPSPKRLSMVPAEYSVVDFDTRLASYSDSERNNSGGSGGDHQDVKLKKKRRESKDDAWVDILVHSAGRRMDGQDVDPGVLKTPERGGATAGANSGGAGKSGGAAAAGAGVADPEMARLEVAQVLAAVRRDRQRSPSPDSISSDDDDGEDSIDGGDFVPHSQPGLGVDMDAHVQGLEIDEIERVPRRVSVDSGGRAYEGEDEDDEDEDDEEEDDDEDRSQDHLHSHLHHNNAPPESSLSPEEHHHHHQQQSKQLLSDRQALRQQRRLGYFDLHPERKKLYDEEAADEQEQQQHTPSPELPTFDSSAEKKRMEAESAAAAGLARADSATLPIPVKANGNGHSVSAPPAPAVAAVANGSSAAVTAHPIGPRAPGGAPAATKTAALIEMYRERERRAGGSPGATAATAAAAPAVPVTTPAPAPAPAPSMPIAAPVASAPIAPLRPQRPTGPALPGATNANTSIDPVATGEPDITATPADTVAAYMEPPRIVLEETGRASPARYIHGAPLHNVVEEEEED